MKVIPRLQDKKTDFFRFQCLKRFGQIHTKKAKSVVYVWRGVIYKCYQTLPLFFIVKIDESNLGWVKVS